MREGGEGRGVSESCGDVLEIYNMVYIAPYFPIPSQPEDLKFFVPPIPLKCDENPLPSPSGCVSTHEHAVAEGRVRLSLWIQLRLIHRGRVELERGVDSVAVLDVGVPSLPAQVSTISIFILVFRSEGSYQSKFAGTSIIPVPDAAFPKTEKGDATLFRLPKGLALSMEKLGVSPVLAEESPMLRSILLYLVPPGDCAMLLNIAAEFGDKPPESIPRVIAAECSGFKLSSSN